MERFSTSTSHTYIHTYTHTYIHTYIHTQPRIGTGAVAVAVAVAAASAEAAAAVVVAASFVAVFCCCSSTQRRRVGKKDSKAARCVLAATKAQAGECFGLSTLQPFALKLSNTLAGTILWNLMCQSIAECQALESSL